MNIQHTIQTLVSKAISEKYSHDINPDIIPISLTKPDITGDFTVTLFPFAKTLQMNPNQLGLSLKENLDGQDARISEVIVVGGFLNFTLSQSYWANVLNELSTQFSIAENEKKTFIIEFSSPNTNKPLHLGHIRNILLGNSSANILKALGHNVIKAQVINDRGIAICKSMLAYEKYGGLTDPEKEKMKGDHFVGDLYVMFENKFKEEYRNWQQSDEALSLYKASDKNQDEATFFANYKNTYFNTNSELGLEARQMLNKWEEGDAATMALWNTMNSWVYSGFDTTYAKLGIEFDQNYYESQTYLLGKEAVSKGLEKGIFERQSDSSVWIDLTDKGLDRKLILRSDGTSVYMTQDIGLAMQRYDQYKFDQIVYVVGDEQNYHFQVLFAIMKAMNEPYADHLFHLSYGMVELPTGKMKSREGTVVDADDLIAEVITEAQASGEERGELASLSVDQHNEIYRLIGLAALKYHMIKVSPKKKMIFDPKESVDMQGQTGPYVQNAYVRIQSILRKERSSLQELTDIKLKMTSSEIELIKQLDQYKSVVVEAAENFDPSQIANYLFSLAKSLHRYYHDVPILTAASDEEKQFRLYLIDKIASFLKTGMLLLGIEMPERM